MTRLVAASALTLAAALAACSGSGSPTSTATGASGGPSSPAVPSSSSDAQSTSSGRAATDSAATTGGSSGAAGAESPSKTVDKDQIVSMARKLGCTDPTFRKPDAEASVAKIGSKGGVECEVGPKAYMLALVEPGSGGRSVAQGFKKAVDNNKPLPYLHGDNWVLIAVPDTEDPSPTVPESLLKDAQRKIGAGDLATA